MASAPLIRSDTLSMVTVMCRSIPEALSFYVGALDFNVRCDEDINGQRLVVASPPNLTEFTPMCSLRFIEARTQRDKAAVGNQAGDHVFLQVETDDWDTVYNRVKSMGVRILDEEPREEKQHRAVTLVDPFGNRVNLIEKTTTTVGVVYTKDVGFQ
ncbi:Glyoxalase/Bleomycin resistance protein/Dihydroxybiphenyl dioxygenase [Mycena pura]|uniref:Glyoxalase/Bleomycin resistance protein/Dihydroxybiphenyl dioxygenase n=1 Tax=Mycena pura TaxID=153505 RepID=A0AAD6YHN1_9AGAR|nr:Glyoxalase/Bleomycin resistance protein/Dihydroxybiphenyl dioxygenase [Mycena pura]